jgi:thioredoxin reductase (NADPH)
MEEATFLSRFASRVTVIHRRDQLRASKAMQDRAFNNEKIEFIWDTVVEEVLGTTDPAGGHPTITGLRTRNVKTGEERVVETGALFVAIGHQPNTGIFSGQIPLDERGYAVTADPESTATTVPGIFVAGDVRDYRYRQAVTAAGDGCKAAMDAERWLEEQGAAVDHGAEVYPLGPMPEPEFQAEVAARSRA